MNTLYYGDNLNILRRYIDKESVDLIYLDPPFNSNRNYNVLFKDESGLEADSQIMAFEDTWHWKGAAATYDDLILEGDKVSEMLQAFRSFIGENQMMAYLVMMAVRLKELHRVLKPTGSLYLHCDPTASHYLKILLDTIFGADTFRNEITWKRTSGRKSVSQYGRVHDIILFYTKSANSTWNTPEVIQKRDAVRGHDVIVENGEAYRLSDLSGGGQGPPRVFGGVEIVPPKGRHWMYDQPQIDILWDQGRIVLNRNGAPRIKNILSDELAISVNDVWTDIDPINSAAQERLGYPTQKPVALLERIISASSNEGDVVLDPFAGCGTTIAAAQKLNRQWIGIDVTQLSIALLKNRLEGNFGMLPLQKPAREQGLNTQVEGYALANAQASASGADVPVKPTPTYRVIGEPTDLHDAQQLATEDRYQFQYWALSQINARPLGGEMDGRSGKKGSDKGIDGIKVFVDDNSGKAKRVIVQVKSGHVKSGDIRDLVGTVDRENAAIGVFLTLEKATSHMIDEAASADFYTSEHFGKFPRIQILTIEEILAGKTVQMPHRSQMFDRTLKQAEKIISASDDQHTFGFE